MKIIKNFCDEDKFKEIQKIILGSNFPFYFNDGVADHEQTNEFYFTHNFYRDYQPTSPYYKLLVPIIDMIKPKSLIRIKANLYPRTEKLHHHKKHEDFDFDNYGLVLSLNDCDGGTQIGDKFIPSIANQAIIFKANVPHNSTTCTDAKARFNINFNYI